MADGDPNLTGLTPDQKKRRADLEAGFETDVAPWDMAGGRVIAEVAGAMVLIKDAGEETLAVASSPGLTHGLLALLEEAGVQGATP